MTQVTIHPRDLASALPLAGHLNQLRLLTRSHLNGAGNCVRCEGGPTVLGVNHGSPGLTKVLLFCDVEREVAANTAEALFLVKSATYHALDPLTHAAALNGTRSVL
jgi:hypothetical protein